MNNSLPQAKHGDWVILAKREEVRGEVENEWSDQPRRPLILPASYTLAYAQKNYFSELGFGASSLRVIDIPAKDDGSALAATLGECVENRVASFNRPMMAKMLADAPTYSSVVTALNPLRELADKLESMRLHDSWRRNASAKLRDGWENVLIPHAIQYGLVYIPTNAASDLLLDAADDVEREFTDTHVLKDIHSTKMEAYKSLGFKAVEDYEERKIRNNLLLLGREAA